MSRPSRSVPSRNSVPLSGGQIEVERPVEEPPEIVLSPGRRSGSAAASTGRGTYSRFSVSMLSLKSSGVDERADEVALVEEMHALRRRVDEFACRACADRRARSSPRRGSRRRQREEDERDRRATRWRRNSPPDDLALRRVQVALRRRRARRDRRSGSNGSSET